MTYQSVKAWKIQFPFIVSQKWFNIIQLSTQQDFIHIECKMFHKSPQHCIVFRINWSPDHNHAIIYNLESSLRKPCCQKALAAES